MKEELFAGVSISTKIKTRKGYIHVKDIKNVGRVFNENGMLSDVDFSCKRLHCSHMIELEANGRKLLCSPDQKVMLKMEHTFNDYSFKVADSIKRGERVFMDDGKCYPVTSIQVCYSDKPHIMYTLVLNGIKSYFANGFCVKG